MLNKVYVIAFCDTLAQSLLWADEEYIINDEIIDYSYNILHQYQQKNLPKSDKYYIISLRSRGIGAGLYYVDMVRYYRDKKLSTLC